MKKALVATTLGQVALLVGVLAGYLLAIAATLRKVSKALGQVTFGVRAIDTQTKPIGPALRDVNADLEAVVAVLQGDREAETPGG